jgi:DNA (cytosine-5)-methyltransferase 1
MICSPAAIAKTTLDTTILKKTHKQQRSARSAKLKIHSKYNMRHLSLFSGIGGFDLAASWLGWENVLQVEIDPFCRKVLSKNFPNVKKHKDIKTLNATKYAGSIDVISGGFPCQPFSVAGDRRGTEDDRYLWPEMLRIISEVKPAWIVAENVRGLITIESGLVFEQIILDMENIGYKVQPLIIPACGINAPHRRNRVWIIAHANCSEHWDQDPGRMEAEEKVSSINWPHHDTPWLASRAVNWNRSWLKTATELCGMDDGLSEELDKDKRITALGNAIVPQIAFQIFNSIQKNELLLRKAKIRKQKD